MITIPNTLLKADGTVETKDIEVDDTFFDVPVAELSVDERIALLETENASLIAILAALTGTEVT